MSKSDEVIEEVGQSQAHLAQESTTPPSISIIVPTYNEAENIEEVVTRIQGALSEHDYEILIVDDDSSDNTWRIAQLLYEDHEHVYVHHRTEDRGLARSVAYGFEHSTKEFCAVIDADLQHPPEKIPTLLLHVDEETDIVVGSRHTDFGRIENWPLWRHFVSYGATTIAKLFVPQVREISDPLSGFFIIRRSKVEQGVLSPEGYKILLEVLSKCEYGSVDEVPYVFKERVHGESKLSSKEYLNFLSHLASLREVSQ